MSTMLIKTINLVCLLAIQSEGIQLNLALRKRAHLSSVSNERHAIYAVDGNVFKTFAQAANEEDSGWFVVDLGRPYMVESILYYIPYCHNCDNNFIIGLSNNFDPQINKTLNSDYKLCGQYNGSLAPDGGVQLQCKDKKAYSRHVIVRQIGKPFLTISELAVLGKYINYIGCFTSLLINETIGLNLSLENCINKCENLNYVYAGIQVTRCVCGNETKNYSPLSECNVLCPGDVDYCGSSNKMSVYEVFPLKFLKNIQRRYIGCSNASPGHFIKYDEDMAVEKCQNHCAKNNFLFFRIQNGSECGCGNLYSKLDVEESSCNITCSGNPFEKCGGTDRKSLYSIYSENGGSSYFKTNHHCKNRSELDLYGICGSKQCEDGWTGEDCAVRDCSVDNGDCGEHVCRTLQGTTGVFSECICSEGFDKNFWWDYCHDINECEDETATCDTTTSTCVNKNGNYECKCFSGFQQNILDECQDIDECVTENRCNVQTTHCHNTFGSYFCTCREGFIYDSPQNCIGRCSEVTILSEEYGSIHFGEGEINETKSSTSKCLESAHAKATGVCLNNSTGVFYWKILEFHCTTENRSTFSEVKKELSDLKDDFTTENFEKTVKKALDVVKNQLKDMSIDDVNTVTRFVEDASNVNKTISEKRAESLIEIMEVAMEAPAVAPNKTAVKHDKAVVKTQISLINTLESVVSRMDLDSSSYNKTFKKFRVEVYEQVEIENRNFTFNPLTSESDDTEKTKGQIEVIIPKEAFESAQNQKTVGKLRANFIIYNSTELFENPSQSESGKTEITKIVSSVISGSIAGANITGLQKKIYLTFQVANATESLKCVFADLSNDSWRWSDEGMETHKENDKGKVLCQSDHLTNFAVLAGYKDDKHSKALTYISIIGMVLSIICLSFLIFTQMFFKKFRKGQYQIALLNLSVSLIIVNLLIILGLDRIENKVVCGIVAALLHYFLLVSFAWMLIEAILQYYKFVKVFDVHVSSFVWKTVLPAWTLPALVVIMTAAIDRKQYSASKNYCWLAKEAFHYAFLLLLAFVVVANTFIFIRIIKGISCDRPKGMQTNQTKSRLVWLQVQAGICCFIVMGLTWCFALFAFGKAATVMHFLFAIFNSMQGCFVFILFCLREKPVRKAWYALLCQGKASKKLISSTDSQSSSSLGKFKRRIKREDNELSSSDFSGRKNTESTDAALSKI